MLTDRPNFGDELTVDLVQRVLGIECTWSPAHRCDLIGVGSTLDLVQKLNARPGLKIWGSGFMDGDSRFDRPEFDFYAVRGRHTLSRIKTVREVAVGDPGLLASLAYAPSPTVPGRIGIVYNHEQQRDAMIRTLIDDPRFTVIDPLRNPADVIADITSCEFVFASSLHGLIVADSYNIPNAWVGLGSPIYGGRYKFDDYYSAFGGTATQLPPEILHDDEAIAQLVRDYRGIPDLAALQQRLIDAFPYGTAAAA